MAFRSLLKKIPDRYLLAGTGGLLLVIPLLATYRALWPGFVGAAFVSTAGLALLWRRDLLSFREVLVGAVILRLVYFPLLPELTDDPFRYIWDGWLQLEGINPYRFVPEADELSAFKDADLFDRLNSQPYYSIYPPLTQVVFALGGLGMYADWAVSYYLIKAVFLGAELGGLLLLARMTTTANVLLYAWNPLVVMETAGQGHVEALLVLCLVGAAWAVQRGQWRTASIAVAAGGLVKLYPFVLWPYLVRRGGGRALWPGVALVGVVSLPYAAPYALPHIRESMDLFARLFEFNAGPYYLVKHTLWVLTGADWSKVIGPVFRSAFLGSLPLLYLADWRWDWSFRRAVLVTIGFLFALSTTVHPWYLVPIVAFSVIAKNPTWPWIWLAAVGIGTYLFYVGGTYWMWIVVGWGGAGVLGGRLYGETLWTRWKNRPLERSSSHPSA